MADDQAEAVEDMNPIKPVEVDQDDMSGAPDKAPPIGDDLAGVPTA